jgi:competence ComEA-like helix-hairpin-helix protein
MLAAAPQSLYDHPLAWVKQNLPPARAPVLISFLVAVFTLCGSACATLPRRDSSGAQLSLDAPKWESALPLNINVASTSELEKLPGVGKVIAERIVAYRAEYGPFRRPEHLMMVRGISDRKFRAILPMIAVN